MSHTLLHCIWQLSAGRAFSHGRAEFTTVYSTGPNVDRNITTPPTPRKQIVPALRTASGCGFVPTIHQPVVVSELPPSAWTCGASEIDTTPRVNLPVHA